jgi:ABC-type Fe3+ transport system substrate-binding protein
LERRCHLGQQGSVAYGQNFIDIDSIFNITEPMKKTGSRVDFHFSTEDATPIWRLMGAVFKEAPHPNAGMLFLAWLLEAEQFAAQDCLKTLFDQLLA